MKIFLLFTLNLICPVRVVIVDAQNTFDPFLLRRSPNIVFWYFPRESIPSIGDENITTSCPAETDEDKETLRIMSKGFLQDKYCLFKKIFAPDEPKYCTEQPKPWLELYSSESCGSSPNHKAYNIGFYYCGNTKRLSLWKTKTTEQELIEKFRYVLHQRETGLLKLPLLFPIYRVCIDTSSGQTLWTKHEIMTPAMFKDDKEKLQRETGGDVVEISTDPMLFEEKTFTDIKQKYNAQNEGSHKMTETFIVPKEHVALRVWRNTVNHFINIAPFSSNLEKLMTVVNRGIKKIVLELHSNNQELKIYTKVEDLIDDDEKSTPGDNQFSKNIWYKLLREDRTGTAALIVLHNTPNSLPEGKICKTEMICDLKKWYEKNTENDGDEYNYEEVIKYAYCCNSSAEEVKKIFDEELKIKGPLNLDDFFLKTELGGQSKRE